MNNLFKALKKKFTLLTSVPKREIQKCGRCGADMKTIKIAEHPIFKTFGHQEHTLICTSCKHMETRQIAP